MDSSPTVVDRPDEHRYVLLLDDRVVGYARYSLDGQLLTIPYVETLPELRGQGFAAQLLDGIVDDARRRGLRIRPTCSYAAAHLRSRSDLGDLVA